MDELTELFRSYSFSPDPPLIELLDINRKPVASISFKLLRYHTLAVSETNNSEKYYLYVDGIGIYFSFFRKLNKA